MNGDTRIDTTRSPHPAARAYRSPTSRVSRRALAAATGAAGAPLTVLGLRGSALAGEQDLPLAVHEVYRWHRAGHQVVVVVSALGRTGDELLAQARRCGGGADLAPRGLAALVASGDAAAAALLVLALDRAGVPAALLDPRRAGPRAAGTALDAVARAVDAGRLRRGLGCQPVVVVAGAGGGGQDGSLPRSGGGAGAGLTARYLAQRLGAAQCRLIEDLDDLSGLDLAAGPKAGQAPGQEALPVAGPLRVVLLGLGTVGGGVYRHLLARLERFAVVGIAVRDVERHIRAGVPATLLERDPWRLLERPCDLVIEALAGEDPAARLVAAFLARGRDVVSANKAVIAADGEWLARHAAAHGAELRFSAAVGGAVPVLEAVVRAAGEGEVRAVRGVLNGTSNFVLDRLAAGSGLAVAVRLAREKGFAEANPARDLDGRDAACKLRILARAAFGVELADGAVDRRGLDAIDEAAAAAARAHGRIIRLVAECRRQGGQVRAEVRPVSLPARHFLAGAQDEENRVVVERAGLPPLRLAGRGAGRWPTSEAVMADVFDLVRWRRRRPVASLGTARAPRAWPDAGQQAEPRRAVEPAAAVEPVAAVEPPAAVAAPEVWP